MICPTNGSTRPVAPAREPYSVARNYCVSTEKVVVEKQPVTNTLFNERTLQFCECPFVFFDGVDVK